MNDRSRRPFYTEYAWAFDLLIDRPVRKERAAVVSWLVETFFPALGSSTPDAEPVATLRNWRGEAMSFTASICRRSSWRSRHLRRSAWRRSRSR